MGSFAIAQWITAILTHASLEGISVVRYRAGKGLARGIAYRYLSGRDGGTKDARTISEFYYQITYFDQGDNLDEMGSIAKAMDDILQGGFGQNDYGIIYNCDRDGERDYQEPLENGQIRNHLGGVYRITVKGF